MLKPSFERKLIKIIGKYRKKGYNDYQIKLSLIRHHYPSNIIENLLNKQIPNKNKKYNFNLLFALVAIILIIPITGFITYKIISPKYELCSNIFCFSAIANDCGRAIYITNVEGIEFIFKTSDCRLIKQVKNVSEPEDDTIQKILVNKLMWCDYNKEGFPEDLVTALDTSLDYCQGQLKDAILSLKRNL